MSIGAIPFLLLPYIAGDEPKHVLPNRHNPTGSDDSPPYGGAHFKVEHVSLAVAVAFGRANILRVAPRGIEQGLSKHLGIVCRQPQARTENAAL